VTLSVDNLSRHFADAERPAVDDVSFTVGAGEVLALVGASGSGKTTTLRMIAGYERPDRGRIVLKNDPGTSRDISDSDPPNYYAQGAAWMRVNIPAGQTVFNTDWDDFPRLFFFDSSHVYVSGLDPTYLLDKDASLSKLYEKITTGDEENPGPLIRDRFGSRWVFTDNTDDHVSFIDNAMKSGWFDRVYRDDDCTILHLRDTKGEPPPDVDTDTDSGGDTDDNDNSP